MKVNDDTDPWALVKNGRYTEFLSWMDANCRPKDAAGRGVSPPTGASFDVNQRDSRTGETLLYTAVRFTPVPVSHSPHDMNYVKMIRLLCETYKADIGAGCTGTGRTAVHLAAQRNSMEILKYLIVTQCGPIKNDNSGVDPLRLAALSNSMDCARMLEEESLRRAMAESSVVTHHAPPPMTKNNNNSVETAGRGGGGEEAVQTPPLGGVNVSSSGPIRSSSTVEYDGDNFWSSSSASSSSDDPGVPPRPPTTPPRRPERVRGRTINNGSFSPNNSFQLNANNNNNNNNKNNPSGRRGQTEEGVASGRTIGGGARPAAAAGDVTNIPKSIRDLMIEDSSGDERNDEDGRGRRKEQGNAKKAQGREEKQTPLERAALRSVNSSSGAFHIPRQPDHEKQQRNSASPRLAERTKKMQVETESNFLNQPTTPLQRRRGGGGTEDELPDIVKQEIEDFKAVYGTAFEVHCTLQDVRYPANSPLLSTGVTPRHRVRVLRIRGLVRYTVRGNPYYAPLIVIGYYPVVEEANAASLTSSPYPMTPPWAAAQNLNQFITESSSAMSLMTYSVYYPRFRAMVDLHNLNKFFINGRATSYLDPLSGTILPSPSDHLFTQMVAFVTHAIVPCFEAVPPMVAPQSQAAIPSSVSISLPRGPQNPNLYPPVTMLVDPLTFLPLVEPRTGLFEAVVHPHPFPNPGFFFSPLTGEPLLPPSAAEKTGNEPQQSSSLRQPPPVEYLLPFTAAKHPKVSPAVAHTMNRHAQEMLHCFQVFKDISAFADGLLTFIPSQKAGDRSIIAGVLPVLGSRQQTVLVTDVDMRNLFLTAAAASGSSSPTSPADSASGSGASPTSTGNLYRVDVSNVERLWNVRVRIEFGSGGEAPFSIPPRVFFLDAAAEDSTPSSSTTSRQLSSRELTRLCFAGVVLNRETGELKPESVNILEHAEVENPDSVLSSTSQESEGASSLFPRPRAVIERTENGCSTVVLFSPTDQRGNRNTTAPPPISLALLSPEVWQKRSRPLLDLLFALKDLATQLLGRLASSQGDAALLQRARHGASSSLSSSQKVSPAASAAPQGIKTLDELFDDHNVGAVPRGGVGAHDSPEAEGGSGSHEKCIICLSGSKEVVFKPCYHLALCRTCAMKQMRHALSAGKAPQCLKEQWRCQVCDTPVQSLSEIYL